MTRRARLYAAAVAVLGLLLLSSGEQSCAQGLIPESQEVCR